MRQQDCVSDAVRQMIPNKTRLQKPMPKSFQQDDNESSDLMKRYQQAHK